MSVRAAIAASWRAARRLAQKGPIQASPAAQAGMLLERARGSARDALRKAQALAPFHGPTWNVVIEELAQCAQEEEEERYAAHERAN